MAGQQLSTTAAETIFGRILTYFGEDLDILRISRCRHTTLRKLGLSQRKSESLQNLAKATLREEIIFDDFVHMKDEEVIDVIAAQKGFGRWSAQMFLLFSLQRADIWPIDDLGIQQGAASLFELDAKPKAKELATLGKIYKPHRSALALHCWRIANANKKRRQK